MPLLSLILCGFQSGDIVRVPSRALVYVYPVFKPGIFCLQLQFEIKPLLHVLKQELTKQEQLAEKLNISVKHYGGVERGNAGLSIENLIEVSDILGIDLNYLIKGEENPIENVPSRMKEIYLNSPPDKRQHIMELLEVVNRF